MNLAIAITVSQYKPPLANLPACDCDAELIEALLDSTTDFDDKLILRDEDGSTKIKKALSEFISQHKGKEIDQVFFYYSGHGDFIGDELLYLLPDYDQKQRRQTSLENSELDSMLRGLKPNLTVKVIDACHSGVTYIKDAGAFQNYIKGTEEKFNKCYFMFSSHLDQESYQNKEFSFFTKCFAQAIAEHSANSIRLKDIIDFISDAFTEDSRQTPFFVVQGDFTEPFCRVTEKLKQRLLGLLPGISSGQHPPKTGVANSSIMSLIALEAKAYCTQTEATKILYRFADSVSQASVNEEVSMMYNVSSRRLDEFSEIPQIDTVASWLYENKNNLFVEVQTEVRKERYEAPFSIMAGIISENENRKYRIRNVKYHIGLKHSTSMPYCCVCVDAQTDYPNLDATVCYIIPLVSETEIRVFTGFGRHKKTGWTERVLQGDVDWTTEAMPLKEESLIQDHVKNIFLKFWEYTLEPAKRRLGLLKDDDGKTQDTDGDPAESESEPRILDSTAPESTNDSEQADAGDA